MSETQQLWCGMRIPIIMVSGAVNSGKTLFGLTIDGQCRQPTGKPTTLVYDQEGSCDTYAGSLNFEHKDTRKAVAAGVHNRVLMAADRDPRWLKILKQQADCNDSPSASLFRAWYLSLLEVPSDRYCVGIVDTFTPLQEGMIDWLRRHPEAFGRTMNEYTKASSMFLWPDVKSMLSHILATDCRLRFETFVLTVHLKREWVAGQPTKNRIAEGLDVLEKLTTLHVELDRTPKAKAKDPPRVPSGILKKERLVRFGATSGEDQPILPPRLPECTPDAIRAYIASPPDFAKLSLAERLPEPEQMTEDERLVVQQQIARLSAEAEAAKVSALELARAAAAAGNAAITEQPAAVRQQNEVIGLLKELFPTGHEAQQWLVQQGVTKPSQLTDLQADGVLSALHAMKYKRAMANLPDPGPTPDENGQVTAEQRQQIQQLTEEAYGENALEEQGKYLQSLGYGSARSLTHGQAEARIAYLRAVCSAPPEIPF